MLMFFTSSHSIKETLIWIKKKSREQKVSFHLLWPIKMPKLFLIFVRAFISHTKDKSIGVFLGYILCSLFLYLNSRGTTGFCYKPQALSVPN